MSSSEQSGTLVNNQYIFEFEKYKTICNDTGWYGCRDFDAPKVLYPGQKSENTEWIYIYIKCK